MRATGKAHSMKPTAELSPAGVTAVAADAFGVTAFASGWPRKARTLLGEFSRTVEAAFGSEVVSSEWTIAMARIIAKAVHDDSSKTCHNLLSVEQPYQQKKRAQKTMSHQALHAKYAPIGEPFARSARPTLIAKRMAIDDSAHWLMPWSRSSPPMRPPLST